MTIRAWGQPSNVRDSLIYYFVKGPIRNAKCWAGNTELSGKAGSGQAGASEGNTGKSGTGGGRQLGNERHFSRLLYCITFFHSALNERVLYGTRNDH